MTRLCFPTIFGLCTLAIFGCSKHPPEVLEVSTLDSARVMSSLQDRLILIDFYAQACPPCRAFDQAVLDDQNLQASLADVVLLRLDVDSPEGQALSTRHFVEVTPTYLVANSDAEAVGKWVGFDGVQGWIQQLSTTLADPVTFKEREARFTADQNFEDALALGNLAPNYRTAFEYYGRAQALDSVLSRDSDVPLLAFRAAFFGVRTGEFAPEEVGTVIGSLLHSRDVKPEYVMEIAERLLGVVPHVGIDVVGPYLEMVSPEVKSLNSPALDERRQSFEERYAAVKSSAPDS